MQFNHDNMTGSFLAADLVTLEARGWDVPELESVLAEHQIRRSAVDRDAAEQFRIWAARLRSAFAASNVDERCEAVNELLAEGTTRSYLTTHDNLRPHLHFAADQDDIVARVKAVTAGGLAIFMLESEGTRLGVCRREGCPVAFVDTSRNGLRAYCSAKCGNYDAVRRHRGVDPR